jgi:internalin A
VRLNIWDFGGQEIMHATHQFFLTERSLYLLVLNGREGGVDEDTEYWLKHIETFGSDSPVIIVQNKIKQHAFELNYRGLRTRYPQIRAFVKTDCKEPIGLKELRSEIQKAISKMPEVRMRFPSHWFKIKVRLEKMKDSFIGYDVFKQLCDEAGLKKEPDRDSLSWVLHCLGIALTYRDDWRLRETSVLKPEWITDGIYRILNAPLLANRQGELYLEDLPKLLPKKTYPREKHRFLVELMRKFSLCFAFPDAEDRYLIPELLGKEEPQEAQQFKSSECLNFEYHYAVLPEGLIPRFIVRSHILSHGQHRWKSGAILVHEECRALIKSHPGDRRVIIRVKGGNKSSRQRLLAIMRYDLDRIHAEFKDRLEVYPKVPLPELPEIAIDYNKLVAFEKQGVQEFPEIAGSRVITVQVTELLSGVDLESQRTESLEQLVKAKSVFFSYSHKDEGLRDELETHLKLLQRQSVVSTWHDRKILPSTEWDREIDGHLESANIILLLVSADFVASNYCWEKEVKRAMERHAKGEAIVIPIILRMCDWERAPFGKLQGLPTNVKPVTNWEDRDAAWTDVVKGIRKVAETITTPTKLITVSSNSSVG